MIDLHYWPTPNGWKITIMLEECGLPYKMIPVNIGRGDQFKRQFLAISPNNRMPALVDHDVPAGEMPISIFESGAILMYLADKTGRYLPREVRARYTVIQWLMWQMSGLGPMAGQNGHFMFYAPEKISYAVERYGKETRRLYRVLDHQLGKTGAFVAGEYSIADMASFPWVVLHKRQEIDLAEFPNLKRWYDTVQARPAVVRALKVGENLQVKQLDDEARKVLFGQDGSHLKAPA